MRSFLDLSSWSAALSTLASLLMVTLVAVGIRIVFMQTLQRRRERENRQINERLKTLIAAYKTLGSSFTGDLSVDPSHRRQAMQTSADIAVPVEESSVPKTAEVSESLLERRRRIRDAVEAALSDVILLGTEEQVRLAALAANAMVAGQQVYTAELVASLRTFVRNALDLEPIAPDVRIPQQGPLRVPANGGNAARRQPNKDGGNERQGGSGAGQGGGMGNLQGGLVHDGP